MATKPKPQGKTKRKPATAARKRSRKPAAAKAAKPAPPADDETDEAAFIDEPPPLLYPAEPEGAHAIPAGDVFQQRFVPPAGLVAVGRQGEHVPTPESRAVVAALAQFVKQEGIAKYLGIGEKTLRQYYRAELDIGELRLLAAAGGTMGLFANRQIGEPKQWLTASMYVLNTRGGWATKHEVDVRMPVTYAPQDAAVL